MMTDKATVEMESPVSGIVVELAGEVGDMVAIGSTLAVIETESDGDVEASPADTPVERQIEAETPGGEEVVVPLPLAGGVRGGPVEPTPVAVETSPRPTPPASRRGEEAKVLASPAVRARAKDLGVDLGQVHAEGDRVRHADLDAYLRYSGGQGYHAPGDRKSVG